jgi:hypothetical protein
VTDLNASGKDSRDLLTWGGEYQGAKDMMHFDWRGGTIKDRSTKPKKKAKS